MLALLRNSVALVCFMAVCLSCATADEPKINDILGGIPLIQGDVGAPGIDDPHAIAMVNARIVPAASGKPAMLAISVEITPPWHTYSTTQKPVGALPTEIRVDDSPEFKLTGDFRPNLPPATKRELGEVFETYENVTWQAPIEVAAGVDVANVKVVGHVRMQLCSDRCLEPTNFAFEAVAAKPEAGAVALAAPTGKYAPQGLHATLSGKLQPSVAAPGSTVNLVVTAEPAKGWHVYALAEQDPGGLGNKPTLIVLTNSSGLTQGRTQADLKPVAGEPITPDAPVPYYYTKPVTWTTPITIPKDAKPGAYPVEGLIGYQTCSDSGCDRPTATKFAATITVGSALGKSDAPLSFADAKYGEAAKEATKRPVQAQQATVEPVERLASLPWIILLSLGGGFILNFMPCVLPVIGLKILSFAEQAGRSRGQIFALNVWYSLGMISVFMVLAALASGASLGLRQDNLGWGEQFSSTTFNVVMVSVVFVMALSFLGVWEIPIPGFVGSGAATEVAARSGAIGAFAKGVLTTVLATPCSGPLLGAVFGYTLNETPPVIFTIFGSIGLGMAAPYLLIGAFPSLIAWLPKPGAWMNTFKEAMGFLMLGTIVYFFSFMNRDYLVPTFALMVGLWAGCWWIGRTSLVETFGRKARAWTQGAAVAAAVGAFAFTYLVPHASLIPWKSFSQAELAKLSGEGKTVVVDFTADWCPNCKYNLKFAIETKGVLQQLEKNNVVPLLADWTDGSAEIKRMLESLASNSIPVFAVFPAGQPDKPIVLHGILTEQKVLDAIEQAGPSKSAGKAMTASVR